MPHWSRVMKGRTIMRETSKKFTVAVYARVATAGQVDTELDQELRQHQITYLRGLAERFGWCVAGEFSDCCHGRGTERPALNAMLECLAHDGPNAVLVKNEGRLGRDTRVVEEIERKIHACGSKVFYADRIQNVLGGKHQNAQCGMQ